MIKYEGQINKLFSRQAVADVVTGLPKIQTSMLDFLFPQSARVQKSSPFLQLDEVTGAIGTVPLSGRGSPSVSTDGVGKTRSIIEPCELKPSRFISARDINDLIAAGDTDSIQAEITEIVASLRDTVVTSLEQMARQAFTGKINFPIKTEGNTNDNFELELGKPKDFGTASLKGANLGSVQKWLEELNTKQCAISGGNVGYMLGAEAYEKVCDIIIAAGNAAPVVWSADGMTLFGKYKLFTMAGNYTLPGSSTASAILGKNEVRTFDTSNMGKLFYCALDDLDARLAPMPFYTKPVYSKDPDGVKIVGMSKPLPAVAVAKMGKQTVTF